MHYSNGRAAKIGDIVRGKGYNIKHEITGLLVGANPGTSTCNCTVATVSTGSQIKCHGWRQADGAIAFQHAIGPDGAKQMILSEVVAMIEYGQLDAFIALDPLTGEVLLPEATAAAVPEQSASAS